MENERLKIHMQPHKLMSSRKSIGALYQLKLETHRE